MAGENQPLFVSFFYVFEGDAARVPWRPGNLVLDDDFVKRSLVACAEDVATLEERVCERMSEDTGHNVSEACIMDWRRMEP